MRRSLALRPAFAACAAILAGALCFAIATLLPACGGKSAFEPLPPTDSTPGAVVTGIVRVQGQGPLTGAVVTLETIEAGLTATVRAARGDASAPLYRTRTATETSALAIRSTVTDERGRYAFNSIAPGRYLVTGQARDHLGGMSEARIPGSNGIAMVETTFVDISLTPTGKFFGRVTLENATLHQSTVVYVDGSSYVAVTNVLGDYLIEGVPVGTWTVRGTHPRYLDRSVSGAIAAAGDSVGLAAFELPLDANIAPVASANVPAAPVSEIPIDFTGSGTDDDGTIARYEWDFNNDGVFEYSSLSTASTSHTYATPGTYTAKLRVTDNQGAIGLDAVTFSAANPIYVSVATGLPANPGTRTLPVNTIATGISIAGDIGARRVVVTGGTYSESPNFQSGVWVAGGYDLATWTVSGPVTTVNVGTIPATADNVNASTKIERLTLVASNPVTGNSIALTSNASTSSLQFANCTFQAAKGANGTAGGPGTAASAGSNGAAGNPGSCDGAAGSGGPGGNVGACAGGAGGTGAAEGSSSPGAPGATGLCSGGAGGSGGASGDPGSAGNNGTSGAAGALGNSGSAASNAGSVPGFFWVPNTSGSGIVGGTGTGGGGGGGGGGQVGALINTGGGNGGGGGGSGGGAGIGGLGGQGGSASFAVFLLNASPTFTNCVFRSGQGGTGGSGGNGSVGAAGGSGGPGAAVCSPPEIGRGGNGGNGGQGGGGGGGAGGPGGPSYGVYKAGTSAPALSGPNFVIGIAGSGGPGGLRGGDGLPAPSGSSGLSGNTN